AECGATARLQQALDARQSFDGAEAPPNARAFDLDLDNAWGALKARLDALAELSTTDAGPDAIKAASLIAALFPDGLGFLKRPYAAEWAESDARLRRVDAEALAGDVDALAGSAFLRAVRRAHEAYGIALGITRAPDARQRPTDLASPQRELL